MSLKTRLAKLEAKLLSMLKKPVYAFSIDGVIDEAQQARIAEAKAKGLPVKIIDYEIV